jgi:hypothetical protein
MPTSSPGPKLLKGAIVAIDLTSNTTLANIVFQYNPEHLSRRLEPAEQDVLDEQRRVKALRYKGAPAETIDIDVNIDAIDQLERGDSQALENGIHPQLAILEMLLYPQSQQVIQNTRLANQGKTEVASGYDAPFILFVWGPKRVLPVKLTSFSVTEQTFDPNLNPIRATVSLSMRVLSYSDLSPGHKGYDLFLAYQKSKERLAKQASTANINKLTGVNISQRIR